MSRIRVFAVVARRHRIGRVLAASQAQMLVVMLLSVMAAGCGAPVPPAASLPDQPTAATSPTTPPAATAT
jgi:hypothetical protein